MAVVKVNPKIKGQAFNAAHFASFEETEAIKRMIADGLVKDEKAGKEAYKACVDAVKQAEADELAEEKKKKK